MSDQWEQCHSCGVAAKSGGKKRKRFNPTPHYLVSTLIVSVGALIYGAQFMGRVIDPGTMRIALLMVIFGVGWYAAARVLSMLR